MTEKKAAEFCHLAEKGHVWEESGVATHRKSEVEVGTSLLGNNKINVIADEVLTYFQCLRSKFDVCAARFETK